MQKEFMQQAIQLSKENIEKNLWWPFGAVVVKNWEVVGRWANNVTTQNDPTAHAEVQAIRDACKNLNTFDLHGCELYTSCEPCPMCYSATYRARIEKIYYGNTEQDAADIWFDDAAIREDVKNEISKKHIPTTQCCREDAIKVFESWAAKEDRVDY
jgi:tRNA(Arg) A34 adenosine deaminase TadA